MCAGVGNLESKHSNLRNVFMSTLDAEDVTIMRSNPAFAGATIFQYDYLNDDVTDFGEIDYEISKKLPAALVAAIAAARDGVEGAKQILVLINPPYAEATGGGIAVPMAKSENKFGVANTQFARAAMRQYGKATNELFMQFIARVYQEIPTAKLAIFSKVKYISTPTLNEFRQVWRAEYLGGFAVHSRSFDGLKGDFPISFFIWDTTVDSPIGNVSAVALDRDGNQIGEKTYLNYDGLKLLTDWVARPSSNNQESIPLKGAVTPATSSADLRGTRWSKDAIAWLNCAGNDFQNAVSKTFLISSGYSSARGFFVTPENLWQAAVVYTVRLLIKPTWLNDRDQFLQPTQPLTDEFKSDCLVWMLFNGSNLTAGADGLQWDNRNWSLVNHFIPYTEAQVGAKGRFESDFMAQYMAKLTFSTEARAVLDQGRALWTKYHAVNFPKKIRDEYKLNRVDAGWYQVRKALDDYSDVELTDFGPFKAAYADLTEKLRPQVFELGFLPS